MSLMTATLLIAFLLCCVPFAMAERSVPSVDWHATLIQHPDSKASGNCCFRKTVDLPDGAKTAWIAIWCEPRFELFVNGTKVGQNNRADFIDFYRIGAFLRPGRNVIAVQGRARSTMAAQISVETGAGRMLTVITDDSWRVVAGASNDWTGLEFDDSAWMGAQVRGAFPADVSPARRLPTQPEKADLEYAKVEAMPAAIHSYAANDGTLMNPQAILRDVGQPLRIGAAGSGKPPEFIVDFGTQVVGYLVIDLPVIPRGALIEIAYAQSIRELLEQPEVGIQRVDLVPLEPADAGKWINPIVKGFRYARFIIHRADEPIEIQRMALRMACYSGPQLGGFSCSDPLLAKTWDISAYSVRLCMQRDHYSDDIKRERTLWMGDLWPEMMTNFHAFRDYALLRSNLPQLAGGSQVHQFLDYQCWWGITLADYYLYSGDIEFVRGQKRNLEAAIEYLSSFEAKDGDARGLLYRDDKHPNWCMDKRRGYTTALQCHWVGMLRRSAELERAVGDEARAAQYQSKADAVAQTVRRLLWDEQVGAFADYLLDGKVIRHYPQDGNSMAVVFGVATPDQARRISDYMADKLHSPVGSVVTWPDYREDELGVITFVSTFMTEFEVQSHFLVGQDRRALDTIRLTWGHMIGRGATTTWEGYDMDGEIPRPGISLCHGWGGGAAWLMSRYVLGVSPTAPGFKTFQVRPMLGDLREVSGTVPTPDGQITVRHYVTANTYDGTLEFSGPDSGEFLVPGARGQISVNGVSVWESGSATGAGAAYKPAAEAGCVKLTFGKSGLYTIRAR